MQLLNFSGWKSCKPFPVVDNRDDNDVSVIKVFPFYCIFWAYFKKKSDTFFEDKPVIGTFTSSIYLCSNLNDGEGRHSKQLVLVQSILICKLELILMICLEESSKS